MSERATLESLQEAQLPLLEARFSDLADFTKLSFSGSVPLSGKIGMQADKVIFELAAKGAIPPKPTSRTTEKAA